MGFPFRASPTARSQRKLAQILRVSFGVEDILDATGVGFLLVKQRFPVGWHPPHRARHRLVSGMRLRRGQARTFEEVFRAIVPEPPLTGLIAGDDRVAGRVMMLCRVLIGRSIAAADMTAFGTSAQMEPPAARRPTFHAAGTARLGQGIDAVSLRFHGAFLFSLLPAEISGGKCS
jgi:hypothetical protein